MAKAHVKTKKGKEVTNQTIDIKKMGGHYMRFIQQQTHYRYPYRILITSNCKMDKRFSRHCKENQSAEE